MAAELHPFRITFTDKKSEGFERSYNIRTQDEATAIKWAEKQREEWVRAFTLPEAERPDICRNVRGPQKWGVKIVQIQEEAPKPEPGMAEAAQAALNKSGKGGGKKKRREKQEA